jgi:hypothetical protein
VLAGLGLLIRDRVTELTFGGGTIKAAVNQATQDAQLIAELREKVEKQAGTIEFTVTAVAAQNDDRQAFDQLRKIADEKGNPLAARAEQVWVTVLGQHNPPMHVSGFSIDWQPGVDPARLSLVELRRAYNDAPVTLRPALIEFIWKRADLPKRDRMAFLIDVLKTDSSLNALEYAGRFFAASADLKLKPLAVPEFVAWWQANNNSIKD